MNDSYMAALYEVCRRHYYADYEQDEVVIPEPYVPHFPVMGERWNGILVLAEAQNLSNTNSGYLGRVQAARERGDNEAVWNRLNLSCAQFPEPFRCPSDGVQRDVAIHPWQNGVMPLSLTALAAIEGRKAAEALGTSDGHTAVRRVAVSNAIPWSRVDRTGSNKSPVAKQADRAVAFWDDVLSVIGDPYCSGGVKAVWAFGAVAQRVMKQVPRVNVIRLGGPFRRALGKTKKDAAPILPKMGDDICRVLNAMADDLGIEGKDRELAYYCAAASIQRWRDAVG